MAKKKDKQDKGLTRKESDKTAEMVLSHPVFQDMANRLKTVQGMLQGLPAAIGAAVAEATKKAPEGASGPPVPLINPKTVEIHLNKLVVDGKTSITKDETGARRDIVIEKPRVIQHPGFSQNPSVQCPKCKGSGIWETGNNDMPCSCPAGKKALFNVAGVEGPVTGEEMERHLFNTSPEPLSSAEFNARRKKS